MASKSSKTPAKSEKQGRAAFPFQSFRDEIDRAFENFFKQGELVPLAGRHLAWPGDGFSMPQIEVKENKKAITINAELPGMAEKDVDLTIKDGVLTLKGEKKEEKSEEKEDIHVMERRYGSFSRSFTLPDSVDEEKVSATFDKGVLKIVLPKNKAAKSSAKKIAIG